MQNGQLGQSRGQARSSLPRPRRGSALTLQEGLLGDAPEVIDSTGQGDFWNELRKQVPGVPCAYGGEEEDHGPQSA